MYIGTPVIGLELKAHPHMLRHACRLKGYDTRASLVAIGRSPARPAGMIAHSIAGHFQMLFATTAPEH
jgi:hypothetical protein